MPSLHQETVNGRGLLGGTPAWRGTFLLPALLCLAAPMSVAQESPAAAAQADGEAKPLRGRLELSIERLTERIDSFEVPSQGRLQQTGPVVLSLDPAYRGPQRMVLDFDRMEVRIDTALVADAPLLRRHRAPPTRLQVSESGPMRIVETSLGRSGRTVTVEIQYETTSKGSVGSGPLAGAAYRNRKNHCVDCCTQPKVPKGNHRIVVNVDSSGNVIGAGSGPGWDALLCAADSGSLEAGGRETAFTGQRTGRVVP